MGGLCCGWLVMMNEALISPKLSRPKLFSVLPRERIFDSLDLQCRHAAVWVSASPGAGKTTLIASYLESRKLPGIWYQMDDADVDLATFFYYLGLALVQGDGHASISLPLLTPERQESMTGFARRFFREFYRHLPRPCTIVFDNFHTAVASVLSREIIPVACEEIPSGVTMILISRCEPPAELVSLVASRNMAVFDCHELCLTLDETKALAATEGVVDRGMVELLYNASGGWAAGIVLMLARRKRAEILPLREWSSQQALFDYFASQIFASATPDTRDLLLRTAVLPCVTVRMAEALTANAQAGKLLDFLYRSHLFTDLREGGVAALAATEAAGYTLTYQYHALFREFLLAEADRVFSREQLHQIKRDAARLLQADGHMEEAVALYLAIADWAAVVPIILGQAKPLLASGRYQVVRNWIAALPLTIVETSAWLLYWQGRCDLPANPGQACALFQRSFEWMCESNDAIGKVVAISGIIESYYLEWNDLNPMGEWIVELEFLLVQALEYPSIDVEICALRGMLIAALSTQPQHALLPVCAQRLMDLLGEDQDINRVVTTGTILLHYFQLDYDSGSSTRIVTLIQPRITHGNLLPVNRVLWLLRYARYCAFQGDSEKVAGSYREALAIIHDESLHFLESVAHIQHLISGTHLLGCEQLQAVLERLELNAYPVRRIDIASLLYGKGWIAAQQSQLGTALQYAQVAQRIATEAGAVTVQALCLRLVAGIKAEQGEIRVARQCLERARAGSPPGAACYLDYRTQLLDACMALDQKSPSLAKNLLESAFMLARKQGYGNLKWWPAMASRLFSFALANDIETDYVRQTIRKFDLKGAFSDVVHWPMPIEIYTLGRFTIVLDDVPLRPAGKSPRKPLDLLKCLIAQGGRQVSISLLIQFLWPDSDGDAAQTTFDSAILRLRRLLGRADAVLVSDGRVTLNPEIVWVDVWAFSRLIKKLEHTGSQQENQEGCLDELNQLTQLTQGALRLYQGHFLAQEEELSWMLGAREKWRSKWLRLLISVGQSWEVLEQWNKATELYQRGLELDPLAEELYCSLMRVHQRRGQLASGLEVYRRCRQMLSVVLGVKPSAETESLHQSLTAC